MPHHKSAVKRLRTAEKSKRRNSTVKSVLRNQLKVQRSASGEEAVKQIPTTHAALDRAVKKGVIPKGRGSRLKSRASKQAQTS